MTDEETLEAIAATEIERLERMKNLGDHGTTGPDVHPAELVHEDHAPSPNFVDGYWVKARRVPAHPKRIGGPIKAIATGLHSTDMCREDWEALVHRWTTDPGDGACATFLIGPDDAHGVLQLMPITRNANHLGGPGHGVFVINGQEVHPNLVTNGIEVHCAGAVRKVNGEWRLVENGKAHGLPMPDDEVIPDPARPGRGWHKWTEYQKAVTAELLADLDAVQAPLPAGVTTKAFGEEVATWARRTSRRVVGHAELDPVHRGDPWPNGFDWLRARLP